MKKVAVNIVCLLMILGFSLLVGSCKKKSKADLSKAFVKYYGGLLADKGVSVLETSDGGFIIGGTTNSGDGPGDIIVIKTDNEGNEVWHQTLGKPLFYDECGSVAIAPDGGYVVVGTSALKKNRVFDITSLEISKDSTKLFAAKLNTFGSVVWSNAYDNPSKPEVKIGAFGKGVVVNSNGDLFLAGMVDSSYNAPTVNLDIYAFIVDKNGVPVKVGALDITPFQYGAYDKNDYVSSVISAFDIGNGREYIISSSTNISGNNTPRIIRCRLNGTAILQNNAPINSTWLENSYRTGGEIIKTSNDDYMLIGTNGNPPASSDIFMIELGANSLNKVKSFVYGDQSGFKDLGVSLAPTNDGGYIILGSTNSVAYTEDAAKLDDVLLVKVDAKGVEQWHKIFGGRGNDSGSKVIQTKDGGYLICGTIAFGDDVSNSGASNSITLIKLNSDGDISNLE